MKRFTSFLFCVMIMLAFALPSQSAKAADATAMFYTQIVQPSTNDVAFNAVDVSALKGNAVFICSFGPGAAGYTNTLTLAHATTAGGTYATITNINGSVASIATAVGTNEYQTVEFDIDLNRLHKFVKATVSKNADSQACTSVILAAPYKAQ